MYLRLMLLTVVEVLAFAGLFLAPGRGRHVRQGLFGDRLRQDEILYTQPDEQIARACRQVAAMTQEAASGHRQLRDQIDPLVLLQPGPWAATD